MSFRHGLLATALIVVVAMGAPPASADDSAGPWPGKWAGEAGIDGRIFQHDAADSAQTNGGLSVYLAPEYSFDWDNDDQRIVIAPFARLDPEDDERSHFDVRELYWRKSFASAELSVGLRKVFWGVTESRHLVDIINQTDLVENLDTEDKLGQPMLSLRLVRDWGQLELFIMPYFRERTFAGREGRPRTPLVVDTSSPVYESGAERKHVDVALRWNHFIGDFDIGLAHFSGTAREPRLVPQFGAMPVLVPHYDQIQQSSIDLQATLGGWLWKLEAATGRQLGQRYSAAVGGFEYTLYGLRESPVDLGLILEYQFDDRGSSSTPFQDDIAFGGRFAFNDTQSSELLLVTGIDIDSRARFTSIEGSRRFGQAWKANIEARLFSNIPDTDPLASVRDDDYFELSLQRYF